MSADFVVSGVIDTNVLVYSHVDAVPQKPASTALLALARSAKQRFAVTPQVLIEFYAIITDGRRTTAPYSPSEAVAAINRMLAFPGMFILPYPADVIDRTQTLLERHPVTGPAVYDLQIVATMLSHGIRKIYTFDHKGFEPFEEIQVETPPSPTVPPVALGN